MLWAIVNSGYNLNLYHIHKHRGCFIVGTQITIWNTSFHNSFFSSPFVKFGSYSVKTFTNLSFYLTPSAFVNFWRYVAQVLHTRCPSCHINNSVKAFRIWKGLSHSQQLWMVVIIVKSHVSTALRFVLASKLYSRPLTIIYWHHTFFTGLWQKRWWCFNCGSLTPVSWVIRACISVWVQTMYVLLDQGSLPSNRQHLSYGDCL